MITAQDENKENIPGAANSKCASPQSESIPSTSKSLSETRRVFSYVTEFLAFPGAAPKPSKSSKKTPGGARVLTSEESLALMKEKEKKKKEEEEAKEMRKKEREAKPLEKEEGKKKKAEERERKKIEREKKVAEMQEKHKQRELKRKEKAMQKSTRSGDKQVTLSLTMDPRTVRAATMNAPSASDTTKMTFLLMGLSYIVGSSVPVQSVVNGCMKTVSQGVKM